ncbi:MAG TPA: rhodanese-like domain-containing protein [Verrucomicrobiae bacterium]|nr:rhodanese-like domain-containing protein [Verrucomicrobiae bacterium]
MESHCSNASAGCSTCAPGELNTKLRHGAGCQLVDVRDYAEFAGGRIAGSALVPLGSLESGAARLDRSCEVVLICRSGRRSREAARRLGAMGFDRVTVLEGGLEAWKGEGLPVERDAWAPWSIERQVRLVAGLLIITGAVMAHFVHPGWIWLSACVGAGLAFAAITDSCMMGNMLAALPWNRRPEDKK